MSSMTNLKPPDYNRYRSPKGEFGLFYKYNCLYISIFIRSTFLKEKVVVQFKLT